MFHEVKWVRFYGQRCLGNSALNKISTLAPVHGSRAKVHGDADKGHRYRIFQMDLNSKPFLCKAFPWEPHLGNVD